MSKYAVSGFAAFVFLLTICTYLEAQNPPPNQTPPPQQNPPQQPVPPNYTPQPPNNPNYTPPAPPPSTSNYTPPPNQGNNPPMAARHVKHVIGTNVTIQGGTGVGTVEDIVFNDNGCIDYVVVKHSGNYVVMPYTAVQFNWDQRVATVNITQEKYREIPTYTVQTLPTIQWYEPTRRDIRQDRRQDRQDRR